MVYNRSKIRKLLVRSKEVFMVVKFFRLGLGVKFEGVVEVIVFICLFRLKMNEIIVYFIFIFFNI